MKLVGLGEGDRDLVDFDPDLLWKHFSAMSERKESSGTSYR